MPIFVVIPAKGRTLLYELAISIANVCRRSDTLSIPWEVFNFRKSVKMFERDFVKSMTGM